MLAHIRLTAKVLIIAAIGLAPAAFAQLRDPGNVPSFWQRSFPLNGFEQATIDISEIMSGGPPRDGIPSVDDPTFSPVADRIRDFVGTEPVLSVVVNGDARAYPLGILTRHEIANDVVGGVPLAVTFCPLCNSGIAFERTVNGSVTEFGVSGLLRNSDMVMYDRNSETFWQQFTGEGIVGPLAGQKLTAVPVRMESVQLFAERHPQGQIMNSPRPGSNYNINPYTSYDSAVRPFLYAGSMPQGIEPMARVIVVDETAWSMDLVRQGGELVDGDIRITWQAGQNSALDSRDIRRGRDVGNIVVQRNGQDIVHDITFAFVFHAFKPDGNLIF